MKTTKKVLALMMAVVMLASVFVFSASALTYNPSLTTGEVGLILKADKTTVNPGDVVKFTICVDRGSKDDFGPWMTTIVYNDKEIAPTSTTNTEFRQYVNECAGFMKQTSTVNFNFPISQLTALSAEEKAYYTKAIMMNGVADTTLTDGKPGNGWTPADSVTPQCEFTMKIANDAAPGTEIWVGNHEATYTKGVSYMGKAGTSRFDNSVYNLTNSMVKLTVAGGEQPQASVLKQEKRQVKMNWEDQSAGTILAGSHQMRVISQVAEADLQKAVGATDDAAIAGKILKAGIVAFKGNKAAFDMEAAKALAQGDALTAGEYSKSETGYIQHADGVYRFGARVEYKSNLYDTAYVTYLAYTDADGATQYLFMDAAEELLYATNQTDIETAWKNGQAKA